MINYFASFAAYDGPYRYRIGNGVAPMQDPIRSEEDIRTLEAILLKQLIEATEPIDRRPEKVMVIHFQETPHWRYAK